MFCDLAAPYFTQVFDDNKAFSISQEVCVVVLI